MMTLNIARFENTSVRLNALVQTARRPEALMREVGRRGANVLKAHFRSRDRQPNRLGGKRTHFWRQVADSVNNPTVQGAQAVISITQPGIAQKVFGGRITPKNTRALTIPVDPLAYGRAASVFEKQTGIKLFLLRKKQGGLSRLLAGEDAGGIKVFYVLASSVNQSPDPDALPARAAFLAALEDQAQKHINRQINSQKQS